MSEQNYENPFQPGGGGVKKQKQLNMLVRFGLIFIIGLILLIPVALMQSVVGERSSLHTEAIEEIEASWGGPQIIGGPMLIVPYISTEKTTEYVQRDGKREKVEKVFSVQHYQILLPKTIDVAAEILPEERYLGIYSTNVYSAPVTIKGEFEIPEKFIDINNLQKIEWERASIVCGIPDIRAQRSPVLTWDGKPLTLESGTGVVSSLGRMGSGFGSSVILNENTKKYPFELSLKLMGSGSLGFTPVGETTTVNMKSTWTTPNFVSQMLPDVRTVGAEGFTATWNVTALNRSYPQTAELTAWPSSWSTFVVATNLNESVSLYRVITRAVKYGVLFIGVTFIGFLAFELATRRRLHYVQYGLVGLAMVLFFLTLLSLAEHIRFILAYIMAALVVISMISAYIGAAMRSLKHGLSMAFVMSILYLALYILLQLEDYAMVMGTAIILVMVAVLMYVTKGVNNE